MRTTTLYGEYKGARTRMLSFTTGKYLIEYCNSLITISYKGEYIQIHGKEPVAVFDVFTDNCEDEEAIDKYFEVAKLPTNGE